MTAGVLEINMMEIILGKLHSTKYRDEWRGDGEGKHWLLEKLLDKGDARLWGTRTAGLDVFQGRFLL